MPYARIEIPATWTLCTHQHLLDTVDACFVSVLDVPPQDAFLRLNTYDAPASSRVPLCHGAHFVFIEIHLFPGRTIETKRRLFRDLIDRFAELGVPQNDVTIALIEVPLENWGLRGGRMAADLFQDAGATPSFIAVAPPETKQR